MVPPFELTLAGTYNLYPPTAHTIRFLDRSDGRTKRGPKERSSRPQLSQIGSECAGGSRPWRLDTTNENVRLSRVALIASG